jgi:hypothetical protein
MVVGFTTISAICAYQQFKPRSYRCVIDTTVCDKVFQWLATCRWFSLGTPFSSTNTTNSHEKTEILLKVALNKHHKPNLPKQRWGGGWNDHFIYLKKAHYIIVLKHFRLPILVWPCLMLKFVCYSSFRLVCLAIHLVIAITTVNFHNIATPVFLVIAMTTPVFLVIVMTTPVFLVKSKIPLVSS